MGDLVRLERDGAVGIVTVDNPPVNSLGKRTIQELADVVEELEKDESVRAVVLTGTGEKAFLAGADISEFPEMLESPGAMEERTAWTRGIFDRLESLPQPVLAGIQAHAVGGGTEVALLCDLVYADERARFGLTEVKLGLIPGGGGTQRLPRVAGPGAAKELLFFGHTIDAAEAQRLGIVTRVVAAGTALEEALKAAGKLADLPAVAVRAAKRAVNEGLQRPLPQAIDFERELFLTTFASEDLREGYQAFLEKRPPKFTHR
jgi:enoyl-CoA hydratase